MIVVPLFANKSAGAPLYYANILLATFRTVLQMALLRVFNEKVSSIRGFNEVVYYVDTSV